MNYALDRMVDTHSYLSMGNQKAGGLKALE